MPEPSQIRPERITLRVCHDLGWWVTVHCSRCRSGRLMRPDKIVNGPGGSIPLPKLLERQLLKCDKCKTRSAYAINVSWMAVGILEDLAVWTLSDHAGVMVARLEERKP